MPPKKKNTAKYSEQNYNFMLVDVETEMFYLRSLNEVGITDLSKYEPTINRDKPELGTSIILNNDIHVQHNFLRMKLNINYKFFEESPESKGILQTKFNVIFVVEDIQNVMKIENGKFSTDNPDFYGHLLGIALSTIRGILFEKTKGHPIQPFMLQLYNTQEILEHMGIT